jgi:GrpB-like predicted nucleotidyltransferase (UPF0157 family)
MKLSVEALQAIHNNRKTHISEYDPKWIAQFTNEAALLKRLFGKVASNIHHIGSSSIPDIKAKPVIDILITTQDLRKVDTLDEEMESLGYLVGGEFGLSGRRFYCKGDDAHCHVHVHIYEANHPSVGKYLLFRDYMINHPNDAKAYELLKTDLAKKYPNNRTKYTESKSIFIAEIFTKANTWVNKDDI